MTRDLAQIKSADNQQVQMSQEIVRLPIGWKHSQRIGAVKRCSVYSSQPLPQYLRPGIFAEALPVKRINHLLTSQALLSGREALGAVDDSIGQEGDYSRFTRMKRGNLFLEN